jgi:RNA polymerase sigma-70 factor (ECF subfamily)
VAASPTLVSSRAPAVESFPAAERTRLLYERYYDRVFGYCLYELGSREEAEDATQTTFLWAFRDLRRGVVPRAEDAWLFTIAKNACRSRHRARGRKRQREVLSDPQLLADVSPAPSRQHDELIGLEDALARMPEVQRRAILLREWRGFSYREIAAELDISGAAVETLIFRARRSLAELLDGKPAPKRARRYGFDFGSLGIALKAALGGASKAKLAAGFAAALVMATKLGGSVEQRATRAKAPAPDPGPAHAPGVVPSLIPEDEATAKDAGPRKEAKKGDSQSQEPKPRDGENAPAASAQPQGPGASLGEELEQVVGGLPLGSEVAETLPIDAATELIDETVDEVDQTVVDVTELLP